jgi:type II secretory ATPase GspE/PulE/Tfp pilus assembly ATPase PilB-like protein
LQIDEQYRQIDDSQLATLQPKAMMQALLVKVLDEGIGRLYFERQSQAGRILWSRDGILQAVVESIDTQLFQGVINEFKLLTHLSLIALKKAKQVEIERSYEGQRILLRFRIMPNAYGEEATLQVLRGTALRFYQQQQIDKLGRDALDAAQILQRRLQEIRDRARQSLNFEVTRSETLPALIQLLKQMEAQVQEIVAAYDLYEAGEGVPSDASGESIKE